MIPIPAWTTATLTLKAIWLALIALAFAIVLALLGVQTTRLEGMKLWPIHIEGWKPRALRDEADLDRIKQAQAAAAVAAKQAKLAQEALYNQLAEKADEKLEAARRDAMADAERYIAAHRVRSQAAGGSTGRTATAAEDRSTASGNSAGSAPILDEVTVSADDIRICTSNTSRLEAVHDWAVGLNRASIAPQSLLPLGER